MMKLKFLLLSALLISGMANAQQGSWLVYGSGYYSNNIATGAANQNITTTSWSLNPGIGYQLNDHVTLGIQGGYMFSDKNDASAYVSQTLDHTFTAGGFIRYTQWAGGIFFFYFQSNLSYMETYELQNYNPVYYSTNIPYSKSLGSGFQFAMFPAAGINLFKGFALNFSFGGMTYSTTSVDNGIAKTNNNDFNINFAQQLNFGLSKTFSCGSHMHSHHSENDEYRKMDSSKDDEDNDEGATKKHKKKRKHHKDEEEED